MKHILPVLTVTALAAAASAQTAPAPAAKQSLAYNRIVASYVTSNDATADKGASVFAQAKIGGGFYVSALTADFQGTTNDGTVASLGWAYSLPTFLGINSDLNVQVGYKSVGVGIRALIGGGVELGLAHAHGAGSDGDDSLTVSASYSLGYLVKGLSLNASYESVTGASGIDTTSVGVGYNF